MRIWLAVAATLLGFISQLHAQNMEFERLTAAQGLSQSKVFCILEDHLGFLWFGTEDGLNRYDGTQFLIYRHDPDNPNSLSDNAIWALLEDKRGCIWIGTASGGLNCYDPQNGSFRHWKSQLNESEGRGEVTEGPSDNAITCLLEDLQGAIWAGTYKRGLNRFDPERHIFQYWCADPRGEHGLTAFYITSLLEDREGTLWIGSYNGLFRFNPAGETQPFTRWRHNPASATSLGHNLIWCLYQSPADSSGGLWIGTYSGLNYFDLQHEQFTIYSPSMANSFAGSISSISETPNGGRSTMYLGSYGGLLRFDTEKKTFLAIAHQPENSRSLSNDQINDVLPDRSGVLWVATESGLNYHSPKVKRFLRWPVSGRDGNSSGLITPEVTAIAQTTDGAVWVGTFGGLHVVDPGTRNLRLFRTEGPTIEQIWTMCPGAAGELWIGTYGDGLYLLDAGRRIRKHWLHDPESANGPANDYVRALLQDRQGMVWVGTWGRGLNRFDPQTGVWEWWLQDNSDSLSLSYNDVWAIHEDRMGRVWIGTHGGGLSLFDYSSGKFRSWQHREGQPASLSHNSILSMAESNTSPDSIILWIGTANGLNRFSTGERIDDSSWPEIHRYGVADGLPNNAIKSILTDGAGNLWIGSNRGISNFDPVSGRIGSFAPSDGLQGHEYNENACARTSAGEMFFGGVNGLNSFFPGSVIQSSFQAPVLITGFFTLNPPVPPGFNPSILVHPEQQHRITLNYRQADFTLEFTALDFNAPRECQFAYRLEGFDRKWVYCGTRRQTTYTNLNPGEYRFQVKGTNSDGIWSTESASLIIIITPPWWRTPSFFVFCVFLSLAALYVLWRRSLSRNQLRNELKMRKFEAARLREIEEMKTRFFTSLSHEFRTPLTLIIGPVEDMLAGKLRGRLTSQYEMILRNSRRLLELIEQLLALSQLEAGSMPLQAESVNLAALLNGLVHSFDSLAERNSVVLEVHCPDAHLNAWVDRDKFEKIVNNLVANALKFTHAGGQVIVTLRLDEPGNQRDSLQLAGQAVLIVEDSGPGIAASDLPFIFDRFHRISNPSHPSPGGFGIGLALVKELVELHRWDLSVETGAGKGTRFFVRLPLGNAHLLPGDMLLDATAAVEETISDNPDRRRVKAGQADGQNSVACTKPLVLIVEDSVDLRVYIADLLSPYFDIREAGDGAGGIRQAAERSPDVIISDILMPGMDGIQFCRQIKSHWETSHIPVILLTAKASGQAKIDGLESGADDFLTKPFSSQELLARVRNLIEQRKRWHEKFLREIHISPANVTGNPLDREFLQKAIAITEQRLSDPQFSSDTLAREMFVSRSRLHRKFMAITGQAPGEFVRLIRLKRAARLLLEKRLSVTQVAYEIGFTSPSHFSKAFRQHFQCRPNEFAKMNPSGSVTS